MRILFYLFITLFAFSFACQRKVAASANTGKKSIVSDEVMLDTAAVRAFDTVAAPREIKNAFISPYYNSGLYISLYQSGVDYYAKDLNAGGWLEMDFEKEFRFTEPDGSHYVFLPVKGIKTLGSNLTTYKMVSGNMTVIITIEKADCLERETGVTYPFRTVIHIEKPTAITDHIICGFYVLNPVLNDIWALESINGTLIDKTKYPEGVPVLEFHIDGMHVIGFGGCNQISGGFYTEKENLSFAQLITTLKACANSSLENDFLSLLSGRSFRYSFQELHLVLKHADQTTLVFKKVD